MSATTQADWAIGVLAGALGPELAEAFIKEALGFRSDAALPADTNELTDADGKALERLAEEVKRLIWMGVEEPLLLFTLADGTRPIDAATPSGVAELADTAEQFGLHLVLAEHVAEASGRVVTRQQTEDTFFLSHHLLAGGTTFGYLGHPVRRF